MSDILEKVIRTTEVGADGGGILKPEQSDRFIDYMFDATVLLNGGNCRTHKMKSPVAEIDKVAVGQRIVRVATEAVDNGDTASADGTLKAFDGWYKRALATAHVVDNGGAALTLATFNKMLKAMPRKFMQKRGELKFYTGSNAIQDYLYSYVQAGSVPWQGPRADEARNGAVRTEGPAGFSAGSAFGVPIWEIPLFTEDQAGTYSGASGSHTHVELTFPQNRILGIKREIEVFREFKPKKDAIEYTVYCRAGTQIENADAYVCAKNVKISA